MQVYTVTTIANTDNNNSVSFYGAFSIWYEVFTNKEAALALLKKWGCESLPEEDEFKRTKDGQNFYYKIHTHYLGMEETK